MDPREANFVSLRATRIALDLVSARNANEEKAPTLERREELIFGGLLFGGCDWLEE
jgi:hypothetical protein